MDADGSALFDTAVLARRDALTPEEPLVVRIAFPGDIPTRGVSFTDPGGETRRFALQISGRDGGLVMEEF